MKPIIENLLTHFLRVKCTSFTVKDISAVLGKLGYKLPSREIADYVCSSPYVFALDGDAYMSRAGAFTGAWFSIKLSALEIKENLLLPGHRCMPFTDVEMPSGTLTFIFKEQKLPHAAVEFAVKDVLPYFSLYGEEYAPQYLAADPACDCPSLCDPDFELPARIRLTVTDMTSVYAAAGLQPGDSLLCRVLDWDSGIIEMIPITEKKENPFEFSSADEQRAAWYNVLENALLESFDVYGPGTSIEDQLATVFFDYRRELCVPVCGSVEKYLQQTKKIAAEVYGVETRLWFKGQDVPAVGSWNAAPAESEHIHAELPGVPYLPVPLWILDSYVTDALFLKSGDPDQLLERLFPPPYKLDSLEKKYFLLQIEVRYSILKEQYNWFADFEAGPVRHRLLDLYSRVTQLMGELDFAENGLALFPQQALVILSQLFNHISHILDSLLHDPSLKTEDIRTIDISIEGMEYNFEDISEELEDALSVYRKNSFSVIKNGV
ncbi:hypothetical protein Trebr_2260 [Treponema brennaborense DSM 12168]|uniref:Uncharacterized protein n=1 Tax=Treponema brennaborense (strain DSM 12168 / CIP 105900 / DD5/3) TaxID=906968 RepID=F4LLM5_TREBD|nr:hypothetical protein Trebr_2260 [Treponema brennaborense DSM 12168]